MTQNHNFLERVSPRIGGETIQIPPPRLCAIERLQRRLAFRNQIYAYRRPSSVSGKMIFSMFPETVRFPVYENEIWWGDSWDASDFGRDFDFSKTFFQQFRPLRDSCPHRTLSLKNYENSEYSNNCTGIKNCYLVFNSGGVEDSMYCEKVPFCRSCIDCTECYQCELCFNCTACTNCYNVQDSLFSSGCNNSFFLRGCRSCANCFGCVNLRHKEYCVFNKQLTKTDYLNYINNLQLCSHSARTKLIHSANLFFQKHPVPHIYAVFAENCSGNCLVQCKNTKESWFVSNAEDVVQGFGLYDRVKDAQDFSFFGIGAELLYECVQCGNSVFNLSFCYDCWENNKNLLYCWMCANCSDCFGCVSLKNKQYCILNKQYSKNDYEALLPKIILHLTNTDEWGEFFPLWMSPHPYNRSVAHRYFPLTKGQADAEGLTWLAPETASQNSAISPLPDCLPDEDITITAQSDLSSTLFRITAHEITRYRQFNAPLPRICYDERMNQRMANLGDLRLHQRTCCHTGKPIETVYPESLYPLVMEKEAFDEVYS